MGRALPEHYYPQSELMAAIEAVWAGPSFNAQRLARLHRNVRVDGRHLAMPIADYEALDSFTATNDAYIRCGLELGVRAIEDALEGSGLQPEDVDHLFFVSVTGVATPSLDARIANRLGLRRDVKRTPIFGLGCVAGAAGIARAADYLRSFPGHVAVLLSVELCSLTLQREDMSIANLIASGLFGDGAAAAVLVGAERGGGSPTSERAAREGGPAASPSAARNGTSADGSKSVPRVVATKSVFYPDTEDAMGWRVGSEGFRVVLSVDVPELIAAHLPGDIDAFLAENGLTRREVGDWIAHPGGPAILEALESGLDLPEGALDRTWRSLAEIGNLSSASVLLVLREALEAGRPAPGEPALLFAMGPGFCSELVLLRG